MATSLSTYYPVIRALLNDPDEDVPIYTNEQLDAAMEAVLNLGKVVDDDGNSFAYDAGLPKAVTPDLTPAGNAEAYARLVLNTAKLFVSGLKREAWRSRSFSQSVGEAHQQIQNILTMLYDEEHGDMMGGG